MCKRVRETEKQGAIERYSHDESTEKRDVLRNLLTSETDVRVRFANGWIMHVRVCCVCGIE